MAACAQLYLSGDDGDRHTGSFVLLRGDPFRFHGFVEDLEGEFAQDIKIKIDRHSQPDLLTIEHDPIESLGA